MQESEGLVRLRKRGCSLRGVLAVVGEGTMAGWIVVLGGRWNETLEREVR